MSDQDFLGARLKTERANHHINELSARLTAFIQTRPYHMRVDVDPQTGQNFLRLQVTKTIPPEIAPVIGDCIHNLRSALDLLVSEIVRRGGESDTSVHFPFHETRDNLVDAIEKGPIKRVCPDIADLILSDVRPYKGGNDALWGMNKLDILDKHRLLITTLGAIQLQGVDFKDENQNVFTNISLGVAADGQIFTPIATQSRIHIKNYGEPAIAVSFGEGQPFERKPIVPTLLELLQQVRGTVETIAARYIEGHTIP